MTAQWMNPCRSSFDRSLLNRSLDRLLAAIWTSLTMPLPYLPGRRTFPGAGILLAISALVHSGVLNMAHEIYGSLGPGVLWIAENLFGDKILYVIWRLLVSIPDE
jgi:hypothetical protein